MEDSLSEFRTRLVALEMQTAVDRVHRENVERRLSGIEEGVKWILRLIGGGIITGIIVFMIAGGFST